MTETIDSANAAASTLFLGQNGEWWDFWLIVSLVFVALAAIAAGITTTGSIISHKREASTAEATLERYKLETAKEIADANSAGEAAKVEAAKANERIAELSTQAEQLRKDTAEAQLALAKFRAPRLFDGSQVARIATAVAGFGGTPFDITVNLESEPQSFAAQIGTLLESAGWVWKDRNNTPGLAINIGKHQAGMLNGGVPLGIEIDVARDKDWKGAVLALGNALITEGIHPVMNEATDNSASPDAVHLYFGSKR